MCSFLYVLQMNKQKVSCVMSALSSACSFIQHVNVYKCNYPADWRIIVCRFWENSIRTTAGRWEEVLEGRKLSWLEVDASLSLCFMLFLAFTITLWCLQCWSSYLVSLSFFCSLKVFFMNQGQEIHEISWDHNSTWINTCQLKLKT